MTMVDLSKILSKPASDVQPPKPLPNGIYVGQVKDYEAREIGEKKTPAVEFSIEILQPVDVDPSECELPKTLRFVQYLTDNSLFRFKDFLEQTLAIEGGQRTLLEMLPEAKGRMLQVEVVQDTYTPRGADTPQLVNNIKRAFKFD